MTKKEDEILLGKVGVDSGQLVICDPGYIDSEWEDEEFKILEKAVFPDRHEEQIERCSKRWFELIDRINAGEIKLEFAKEGPKNNFSYNACSHKTVKPPHHGQLNYKMGHPGVAVVFSSGIGDGLYPVYGKIENVPEFGKRIVEVRIDLLEHVLLD